ncbi:MAG TPA: hypothetical protein VME21_10010 [Steroidobacteraceae bacterium]|nr:hypothetical protein [Steroidobacteraceae bacterium]
MSSSLESASRSVSAWQALRQTLRTTVVTGFAQAAIQLLGFLGGLIVLRRLSTEEYAWYTVANAVLGTMTVVSDSGISQSVMAQGGKVWRSHAGLGAVIAEGIHLRRRFAVWALACSLPILFLLLRRQHASVAMALLVSASIMPLFVASLTGQLLQVPLRLHQRVGPLQRVLLWGAGLRLVLMTMAVELAPLAWVVSLLSGLAQNWANWRTRRLAREVADLQERGKPALREQMLQQVRRTAPYSIYYAFEGQITVWLVSLLGQARAVAQVGALGRLAMVFQIGGLIFAMLWMPRFARMAPGAAVLRRFWQLQLALACLIVASVGAVAAAPHAVLWVLGPSYGSLTHEVVLMSAAGALSLAWGAAYQAAAARSIVLPPLISVPGPLALQVLLIALLPVGTVSGVLWLSIASSAALWCVQLAYVTWVETRHR